MKIEGKAHGELAIKRLYLPGVVLIADCPRCWAPHERDMSNEYLSYPKANTEQDFEFYCEPCDTSWTERAKFVIGLESLSKEEE